MGAMHKWDGTTAALIHDEQTELVVFLRSLPANSWDHPSLCSRWSVRDVVVHTAAHIHGAQQDRAVIEHFSDAPTNKLIEYLASAPEEHPDEPRRDRRLVAEVQRGELMIHHQDVRRALGIARAIPIERVAAVLSFGLAPIGSLGLAFARERVGRLRLVSTENDWSWGRGREVRGQLESLLMASAGRESALAELDGPGVAILADHMHNPTPTLTDLLAFSEAATSFE
jgi:uncharacterized protein (TIGR03083 family)